VISPVFTEGGSPLQIGLVDQDEDAPHGGIAKLFNEIKKYAVSRSGEVDTSWHGSVLLRDIVDAV
jgi:hypothetical protein